MTALKEFDRLEAVGLWRADAQAQRREVVVSLGDATLTLSDPNGTVLAHWSLGAVRRKQGPRLPALFHPDTDPDELLELGADETEMIAGIDRLLRAIDKRRPRPGKLRFVIAAGTFAAIAAVSLFWVPDALERYAVKVVPPVKRAEIGTALLGHLSRVTGQPCRSGEAHAPLDRLAMRLLGNDGSGRVVVLRDWAGESAHLPGGIVLLDRQIIEDHEDPDVAAGYIVLETVRRAERDPLADLLDHAGLQATLRLLTTGSMTDAALAAYAETLLTTPVEQPSQAALLRGFETAQVRSTPYAYARDITGESTLALIEGDPGRAQDTPPVLTDSDWVRLQGICGA